MNKSFYYLNAQYINDMYQMKNVLYNLRDNYKFKLYRFKTKHMVFDSIQYSLLISLLIYMICNPKIE